MGTALKLLYITASKLCVITNERQFEKIFVVVIIIWALFEKAIMLFGFLGSDSSNY